MAAKSSSSSRASSVRWRMPRASSAFNADAWPCEQQQHSQLIPRAPVGLHRPTSPGGARCERGERRAQSPRASLACTAISIESRVARPLLVYTRPLPHITHDATYIKHTNTLHTLTPDSRRSTRPDDLRAPNGHLARLAQNSESTCASSGQTLGGQVWDDGLPYLYLMRLTGHVMNHPTLHTPHSRDTSATMYGT